MKDHEIVVAIHELLDGKEWDSDTLCAIETILNHNGYRIRDINEDSDYKDWQYEAINGDTKLGFFEWMQHKREQDNDPR